ncbi:MAG: hypothetical protein KAQ68_06725 [Clostridiales bacterium]|nr:hypothetical protein [Clostridiales bacterium]
MTNDFKIGVKIYSSDWFWKYNLSYQSAANELKDMGINYVIAQNKYLPMNNSAVDSEIPVNKLKLMQTYDDRCFRDALCDTGIDYLGVCNFFFDIDLINKHNSIPVNSKGTPAEKIDWYLGGCPTCDEYVDEKINQIKEAMENLDMDGIFLGFMRYPGFWELWLPETDASKWDEYCFCNRCITKFKKAKGISIPKQEAYPGEWIKSNAYSEWVDFKGDVIFNIIKRIRKVIKQYNQNAKIILNTVPFNNEHFLQYGKEIFAQDTKKLSEVVDIFEVMGYHQILKLPYSWIAQAGQYFKEQTNKQVICTVQAKALYLDGIHANKGRAQEITPKEFNLSINSVKNSGLDGIALFIWADFLKQKFEKHDTSFIDSIKQLAHSK